MGDTAAVDRLRQEHLDAARRSARYLYEAASAARMALNLGRVPGIEDRILTEAVTLLREVAVLQAIPEMVRAAREGNDGS